MTLGCDGDRSHTFWAEVAPPPFHAKGGGERVGGSDMMRFWDFPPFLVQPSDHLFGKGDYYACRALREGEIIRALMKARWNQNRIP